MVLQSKWGGHSMNEESTLESLEPWEERTRVESPSKFWSPLQKNILDSNLTYPRSPLSPKFLRGPPSKSDTSGASCGAGDVSSFFLA